MRCAVFRYGMPNSRWSIFFWYDSSYTSSSSSGQMVPPEVFDSHRSLHDRSDIVVSLESHVADGKRRHDPVVHIFVSRGFLRPSFEIV